jgi:hypothetical protein
MEPPKNLVPKIHESIRNDGTKNLKITSWCRFLFRLGKFTYVHPIMAKKMFKLKKNEKGIRNFSPYKH